MVRNDSLVCSILSFRWVVIYFAQGLNECLLLSLLLKQHFYGLLSYN